ncbi:MAG TPA: glucose 1-dehydrogenase [Candidatus Binataceae bacterium]|jgi:NAD(P)-dependent dehydrogenase (short-subunit alcohol dehydrogenase family)|nr:glucose 1-dehydrogenase [Candidatus Binataceae bacterium]
MRRRLSDKVILVTGAASGIGQAAALRFAEEEAVVIVADVQETAGHRTVEQIEQAGGTAVFIRVDVSQPQDIEAAFRQVKLLYGRLDCACNNAGIDGDWADTLSCSTENFDRVYQVNVKGVWLCMREELQLMLAQGRGSIVNTASVAGHAGFIGYPAYTASKHAVMGLTKVAALEYAGRGIRVNAVCPGIIHTPLFERYSKKAPEVDYAAMEPVGRLGRSNEVAEAMLWLCSDESSFVTGSGLVVDGGFLAR